MKNFTELLQKYPRLRDWYQIGPVQRAELESLVADIQALDVHSFTYDGVGVGPGDTVWVFDGVGKIVPTTVKSMEAVTNYFLFENIPVANSFSTEKAAQLYRRYNK